MESEENRKEFYTIAEAIKIKGISEEELFRRIRCKEIKTKQFGMRTMIYAESIFDEIPKQEDSKQLEHYLEQLRPKLIKMLDNSPKYGSCGIIVTFHDGLISKVSIQNEDTVLVKKKV